MLSSRDRRITCTLDAILTGFEPLTGWSGCLCCRGATFLALAQGPSVDGAYGRQGQSCSLRTDTAKQRQPVYAPKEERVLLPVMSRRFTRPARRTGHLRLRGPSAIAARQSRSDGSGFRRWPRTGRLVSAEAQRAGRVCGRSGPAPWTFHTADDRLRYPFSPKRPVLWPKSVVAEATRVKAAEVGKPRHEAGHHDNVP